MAFATLAIALFCMPCFGQDAAKNDQADNIIGKYEAVKNGNPYRVQISKNADGTYKAQIYWLSNPIDPETGKPSLDKKNPDKSLRNTPSDQVVLIRDLKYKAAKKQWGDAKIYDPRTETLRESIRPAIGIRMCASACSRQKGERPRSSEPITRAVARVMSVS